LLLSFIDGTAIYGINSTLNSQERSFKNGLFLTSKSMSGAVSSLRPKDVLTNRTCLPTSNDTCSQASKYPCFYAGEYRTSENLGLVGVQTLFNREHNRIAAQLAALNPKWTDEILFQETRRIVIAELQHITFNEYVPVLTGNSSLAPLKTAAYFTGYNANVI
jgi:peroxidase